MDVHRPTAFLLPILLSCTAGMISAEEINSFQNDRYSVAIQGDGIALLTEKESQQSVVLRPRITVKQTPDNALPPALERVSEIWRNGQPLNYLVDSWMGETDLFQAPGSTVHREGSLTEANGNSARWDFPANDLLEGALTLTLSPGDEFPRLSVQVVLTEAGAYSISYSGLEEAPDNALDWSWKPMIWSGLRFPEKSYLIREYQCTIPATMYSHGGRVVGLAVDPDELAFRLPVRGNSKFGVVLRSEEGRALPMAFFPVPGSPESHMTPGSKVNFTVRPFVGKGSEYEWYRGLATGLYGFGDYRENSICTLNQTIDNITDYLMEESYSYWLPNFKTWAYFNDRPGYGRQQSAMAAVSLAFIRDSPQLYWERALPTVEYQLSRRSQYFNVGDFEPETAVGLPDSWTWDLTTEWAGLNDLARGATPSFRANAIEGNASLLSAAPRKATNEPSSAVLNAQRYLHSLLAMYRLTGREEYLRRAIVVGDDYLEQAVDQGLEDFRTVRSSFWSELNIRWDAFLELFRYTGDDRYLSGARRGLEELAATIHAAPAPPPGTVTVNEGGNVRGIPAPEETVPAWRVSSTGLWPEAAGTAHNHRGIFMTPYAGYMMRAARDFGDDFLGSIGRSAVIGRYCNYSSYAYRHFHTTVFEKVDYPLRPFEEMTYTSVHYNHPLPKVLFLMDYLFAEAELRSGGLIGFPSLFTDTSAYFKFPVYGHEPGTVYNRQGIIPWMPRALMTVNHPQVNYLAGRGADSVVLIFMNASDSHVVFDSTINSAFVELTRESTARVYQSDGVSEEFGIDGNTLSLEVEGKGIVTVVIDGAVVNTQLPDRRDVSIPPPPPAPCAEFEVATENAGIVRGRIISFADELTSLFVWSDAGPDNLEKLVVSAFSPGMDFVKVKGEYPFEATIPLPTGITEVVLQLKSTPVGGTESTLLDKTITVRAFTEELVIHVNDSASGTGDGSTWENGIPSIETAMEFAREFLDSRMDCAPRSRVEILAAAGTHKIGGTMTLPHNMTIRGGFDPSTNTQEGYTTLEQTTTGQTVVHIPQGNASTSGRVELENLKITGASDAPMGGGILIEDNTVEVILSAIRLVGNTTIGHGGGIAFAPPSSAMHPLTLRSVIVDGNAAPGVEARGGGIYLGAGTAIHLEDSVINGNTASAGNGGGLFLVAGGDKSHILRSQILNNAAANRGGGIYTNGEILMEDSVVASNIVTESNTAWVHGGGGLFLGVSSPRVTLDRSIISGNAAHGSNGAGGGIQMLSGDFLLVNGLLLGNAISEGPSSRGGAINIDGGMMTIINSTFAYNFNPGLGRGGGIMTKPTGTEISNTLFSFNTGIALATISGGNYSTTANHLHQNEGSATNDGDPLFHHNLFLSQYAGILSPKGRHLHPRTGRVAYLADVAGRTPLVGEFIHLESTGTVAFIHTVEGSQVTLLSGVPLGNWEEGHPPIDFTALDARPWFTSPLTGAADPTKSPGLDIRGVERPRGDGSDIGAFENRGTGVGVLLD